MKSILFLLFLIKCVLFRDSRAGYFPKLKIEVKNELRTDEKIVSKAGQYTKVRFIGVNEDSVEKENKETEESRDKIEEKEDKNDINFSITKIESFCKLEENKKNPQCLRDRSNNITNLMETDMPEIITEMQYEGKDFTTLGLEEQLKKLESYEQEIKDLENGELNKLVEKLIEYSYYLSLIDCSTIYSNISEFSNCRKNKRKLLIVIYQIIINKFKKSNQVDDFLEKGISDNREKNFKYFLWLLNAFTLNSDSFPIGTSQSLYYLILRTKNSFAYYLLYLEKDLRDKEIDNSKIFSVKKDVSILFAKIMSNLINIFYYDEYDGTIKSNKKKTGILYSELGVNLHKYIMDFLAVFNQFGDGEYEISDKISFFIKKYHVDNETSQLENVRQLKEEKENDEQEIYSFPDKGISVILNPKKIFQKIISKLNETNEAYQTNQENQTKQTNQTNQTDQINLEEISIQIVNIESPLVPIKRDKDEATIRYFVDISTYNKYYMKTNLSSLVEDEKPIILYNTEYYPNLKHCFYFNEDSDDLDTQGVKTEFNFNFNGTNYLKCSSEHLTSFTAGDYVFYISAKEIKIIIYVVLIVVIIFAIVTIYITLKRIRSNNKEKTGITSGTQKNEEKKEKNNEESELDNF